MTNGTNLKDVKLAFVSGFRMSNGFEQLWKDIRERSTGGYRWKNEGEEVRAVPIGKNIPAILNEFRYVEEFYLNARSKLMISDDRLKIERCIPNFRVQIRHHANGRKLLEATPDIILTYYQTVGILTVTVNFQFEQLNPDDLIYLKSLKWDSSPSVKDARKLKIRLEDDDWSQDHFNTLFYSICDRIFDAEEVIEAGGEVVLDTISFRGFSDDDITTETRNEILYGLITGDEGYKFNTTDTINSLVADNDSKLDTRHYFQYFFSGTTVLGDLKKNYKVEKKSFSRAYRDRYGNYPPYNRYLDFDSKIAALEDGMYLFGEIALVRFVLLQYIDTRLEDALTNEIDSSLFPRGADLKNLEETKEETMRQLTNIDMLTDSVLGIGAVPSFDAMFGYETTRKQVREKLSDLNDSIHYRYNRRTQTIVLFLLLTAALISISTLGVLVIETVSGLVVG